MPNLTNVVVSEFALGHKDDITVIGGRHSIPLSQLGIGTLALYVPFPSYDYCMSILEGSNEITNLVIGSNACPFENVAMTRHAFPLFTQLWLECIPALLSCCV